MTFPVFDCGSGYSLGREKLRVHDENIFPYHLKRGSSNQGPAISVSCISSQPPVFW